MIIGEESGVKERMEGGGEGEREGRREEREGREGGRGGEGGEGGGRGRGISHAHPLPQPGPFPPRATAGGEGRSVSAGARRGRRRRAGRMSVGEESLPPEGGRAGRRNNAAGRARARDDSGQDGRAGGRGAMGEGTLPRCGRSMLLAPPHRLAHRLRPKMIPFNAADIAGPQGAHALGRRFCFNATLSCISLFSRTRASPSSPTAIRAPKKSLSEIWNHHPQQRKSSPWSTDTVHVTLGLW